MSSVRSGSSAIRWRHWPYTTMRSQSWRRCATTAPDVVFNLCESFFNERSNEPNIPALLELLRVPYTGAGPDALLLCKDKELAKTVLVLPPHQGAAFRRLAKAERPGVALRGFSFPAFVKPLGEESSEGIAKASFGRNEKETIERTRFLHEKPRVRRHDRRIRRGP